MSLLSVKIQAAYGTSRNSFTLNTQLEAKASPMVVFGRSGAGKSSFVNAIAGLFTPQHGHISVGGHTVFDSDSRINVPPHKRGIGYVFQDARLFPHVTVRNNLLFANKFLKNRRDGVDMSLDAAVDLLDLSGLLDRMPSTLSGGEKQRVAIGRALLSCPRILIMDEPLANLDGGRRHEVLSYIERLVQHSTIPLLYISHAMEEVTRIGRELIVMDGGKIIAAGEPTEILARLDLRPMTGRFQAGALVCGEVIAHDAEFDLSIIRLGGTDVAVPKAQHNIGEQVRLHIRAQDVSLSRSEPERISIRNILFGRIIDIQEEQGPFAEIALLLPDGQKLLSRITRRAVAELDLKVGLDVYALIKSIVLSGHATKV